MVLSLDTLPAHLPLHTTYCTPPTPSSSAPPSPSLPALSLLWNEYKGLWYLNQQHQTTPDNSATTPDPAATTPTLTPIDLEALNIKTIGTIPFACILQDSTPAHQLQIMLSLLEEHLCAGTTPLEQKTEERILHKVVPPKYHEFADMFSEGSAKELPPHQSYDHKIYLKEGTSASFGKIYNMSEMKLWALKDYLNDMLGKGFICSLISTARALVLFAKKKDGSF
ncbi:hypothetical protein E4T56_gene18853 [Termitomyces sp. T112]|nr:hypothetical protein E4T56_gene18853 [Termitomyces sp. T112]